MDLTQIIQDIKNNLTPELLKKEYREQNKSNPLFGHCYVATEALYHSIPVEERINYKSVCGKDDEGITHWWIENKQTGEILDITGDQYYSKGKTPPYRNGRTNPFLTSQPSKRCRVLLDRLKK